MQTRQPNLEGTGEIVLRRLVKEALRMRPDWLIVGEVRQEECLDLLMIPLVYLLISVFYVQRAAFGTTEAARQAGRAFARADSVEEGEARATAAARLALRDQGITLVRDVSIRCLGGRACLRAAGCGSPSGTTSSCRCSVPCSVTGRAAASR